MKLVSCLAIVASAIATSSTQAAWTITSSDATASEEIVGPHQEYTKIWTVAGNDSLASLRLDAAGPVFVDVDGSLAPVATEAPATTQPAPVATGSGSGSGLRSLPVLSASASEKVVAKIVFTGNCTNLLDVFEVVDHDGDLKIHFKNEDYKGYGYVLTQVFVAEKDALTDVTISGDSDVYVSENVIASSGNETEVSLSITGGGDLFVTAPSTDVSIKSLSVKISGDGKVQFNTSSLTIGDSIFSKVSGDGDIAVLAAGAVTVNNTLSTSISGDGNVYVQAAEVKTFVLKTKISGDGYVAVSSNGSSVSQEISISGTGTVQTGSITSVDTKIKISGEAEVLVQTTNTLRVPSYIDGKVQYVGATPALITDGKPPRPTHVKKPKEPKHHGFWWWDDSDDDDDSDSHDSYDSEDDEHHLPKSVTQAPENVYKVYTPVPVPAREPVFLILSINRNWWWEDPNSHFLLVIGGVDVGTYVSESAQKMAVTVKKHATSNVLGFISVAGIAAVAAGVALRKRAARNRRREYQPLLQVTTSRN